MASTVVEIDHLYNWLATLELSEYYDLFRQQKITYDLLPACDKSVLKEIGIYKVGDLIKLSRSINDLKIKNLSNSIQLSEFLKLFDDRMAQDQQDQSKITSPSTNAQDHTLGNLPPSSSSSSTFGLSSMSSVTSNNASSTSLSATLTSSPPQHSNINFILPDGSTKRINVEGCFNSESIKRKILKKLNMYTKGVKWDTYLVDQVTREPHRMFDVELVTVCHSIDDPNLEKNRILLCQANEKPTPKALETSNRIMAKFNSLQKTKAPASPRAQQQQYQQQQQQQRSSSASKKDSQLRSFFGQRPPSELISNNLAEYFPDTKVDALQETVRNSVRMSKLMNSPRFSIYSGDRPMSIISSNLSIISNRTIGGHLNNNDRVSITTSGESSRTSKIELIDDEDSLEDESILSMLSLEDESGPKNWLKGAKIGSGSFGTVYLGMNALTGELMAVKAVELPQSNQTAQKHHTMMIDALKQEMSLLRNLHHENIVSYIGSNSDSQFLNIFLEYVPGGSVTTMLNNYGPFEEPLIRNFIKQILNGLSYLHAEHIIHRDIKGANVLIDIKGTVKISDFGISKKITSSSSDQSPQQSTTNKRSSLQGSVYWMAPEVVKQTAYTPKADIWSVGCLVVEMFTGKHPFPDFSQMQAIFKIGTHTRPTTPAWATEEAKFFLQQTFELDYQKRPSAHELLQHEFLNSLIMSKEH